MLEVELKFAVHGSFVMPPIESNPPDGLGIANVERLSDLDIRTTYHDTTDLRLARSGITLRYRTGEEGGPRWTLKLPVVGEDASVRDELNFDGNPTRVPDSAKDLTTAFVRAAPLAAVATVRTRRHRWLLTDAEGGPLAEIVDDEVSVLERRRVVARFREIEVEARSLARTDLRRVAEPLLSAGAVASEPISKAVRALGPRATAPADIPFEVSSGPELPAATAIVAALARGGRRLVENDPGVRLGNEIEAVHQMRVAARRMRSDLRTFGPLVDDVRAGELVNELRWLAAELGAVRDLEVQEERLRESAGSLGTDVGPLFEWIAARHEIARRQLLDALAGERYVALLDRLVDTIADPPLTEPAEEPARRVLPPLVRAEWLKLARAARKLDPKDDDDRFHRVRIRAKRARYAAEAVAPALGSSDARDARRFARRCSELQDELGALQDAVVASETILTVAGQHQHNGSLNLALGRLLEIQERGRVGARERFPELWKAVDNKKNLRWFME